MSINQDFLNVVFDKEDVKESLSIEDMAFSHLLYKARDLMENSEDFDVKVKDGNIKMTDDGLHLTYRPYDKKEKTIGATRTTGITKYALSQLSTKIGVPAGYLIKCVENDKPVLAQHNVNSWLKDYKGNLFIRECNGHIRGILSDRYTVCDTYDVLQALDRTLDLHNFNIKGHFLSEERFHLRLTQRERMDVPGEDLFAGLSIDNSDVGRSTLTVRFLIYKQVCTNGLIVSKGDARLFKQRHIGIDVETFERELTKNLELFPEITRKMEERIERARNLPLYYNFDYQNKYELDDLVEHIREDDSLEKTQADHVVEIIRSRKYEQNKWGYINALTEVAQELTLEKRLNIEKYAGKLLVA